MIPYDRWLALSVEEVVSLFAGAPFKWCLAGGYAVEQFVGRSIRPHGDIDVVVFREDQIDVQRWLDGWAVYAADPPGTLRAWQIGEYLSFGIHDIWGHQRAAQAWQMQLMLAETEADEWFSRRHPTIRGHRGDLMVRYQGVPCIRIEVQLMYKARQPRPKDVQDFRACLPLMSEAAKAWLKQSLQIMHPEGHAWIGEIESSKGGSAGRDSRLQAKRSSPP
jgi:hypothetical protein